jgi:hypothetical protein
VSVFVPATLQHPGQNLVQLRFQETQELRFDDEEQALPVSAQVFLLRFETLGADGLPLAAPLEPPIARLGSMDADAASESDATSRLEQPAGTCVSVATNLPDADRVALRIDLDLLESPVEWSLVTETGERHELIALDPATDAPGSMNLDLGAWSGQTVRLESRVTGAGSGEVHQRGLVLLAPEADVQEIATALPGELEVLVAGETPTLAWTVGQDRLVVDLARRRVSLHDALTDEANAVDLSASRQATTALLLQQLSRHLLESEGPQVDWAAPLRAWQRRQ